MVSNLNDRATLFIKTFLLIRYLLRGVIIAYCYSFWYFYLFILIKMLIKKKRKKYWVNKKSYWRSIRTARQGRLNANPEVDHWVDNIKLNARGMGLRQEKGEVEMMIIPVEVIEHTHGEKIK